MLLLGPLVICLIALLVVRTFIAAAWRGHLYIFDKHGRILEQHRVNAVFTVIRTETGVCIREQIQTDIALRSGTFHYESGSPHETEGLIIFSPTPLYFDEILEVLGKLPVTVLI